VRRSGRLVRMVRYNMIAAMLLVVMASAAAAQKVEINRHEAQIERKRFDPKNPPRDMPPLAKDEAAVCKSIFGIESAFSVEVVGEEKRGGKTLAKVKVAGVSANLSLKVAIWNPNDASKAIVEHEEGHRKISEHFYRDAEKIAEGLAREYVGKVYMAEGRDADEASRGAVDKALNELSQRYMGQTQVPSAKANEIFDEITSHGRNQRITVEKAMKQAIERATRK
jgi:hypothetical protein